MAERKLENLNRVVIPNFIRKHLDITENSVVMLTQYQDRLLVYKFENSVETYNGVFLSGITRPVDFLGRLTIPIEMIRALDMCVGEYVDINLEGNSRIFSICPKHEHCAICGKKTDLISVKEHLLCSSCIHDLQDALASTHKLVYTA